MKVFISWSGTRSRNTAALLHKWLPQLINEIDPWMSDNDLKAGGDWGQEIKQALDDAVFGIICVTPGNMVRPWLLFEAGALSRRVNDAPNRVAPFLIGFQSKSDLPLPLARFQATEPTKDDMKKLLVSMNELCVKPRTIDQLTDALDLWWDRFWEPYVDIRDSAPNPTSRPRTERQLLDDILAAVRSLEKRARGGDDVPKGSGAAALSAWSSMRADGRVDDAADRLIRRVSISGLRIEAQKLGFNFVSERFVPETGSLEAMFVSADGDTEHEEMRFDLLRERLEALFGNDVDPILLTRF